MSVGMAALGALVFVVVFGLIAGAIMLAVVVTEDSPGCGFLIFGLIMFILVFVYLLL